MKPMNYEICKKHYLKKVQIDNDKINSILVMHKDRINFIEQISNTKINKKRFCSIICENYYEIIKELLIALLLKKGLKSKNHECLISYFKYNFPEYEQESIILHQLKDKRNLLHYEAKQIDSDYLIRNELEFIKIIKIVTSLIKKNIEIKY